MNMKEKILIKKGDIVEEAADAIVNAANTSLLGGGGVDGAIHKKAGPELLKECRKIGGCNTGEAVITKGYDLKVKYVIHTPGPVYRGGSNNEDLLLKKSYHNSMKIAHEYGLKSICFPAISTGVYGFPKIKACEIAIKTVYNFIVDNKYDGIVKFILFDDDNFEIYKNEIGKYYEL